MKKKVELLAPAGSWESLEAGICAGADAVYTGGSLFGARAYADNLDEAMLLRAIDYVHLHGRKIYLTVNTLLKEKEMQTLRDYLLPYYRQGLDAVIVQDIGVMQYIRRFFPGLSVHVSTQATVTHTLGARFWEKQGADRVVPARELSLPEIRDIKEHTELEIECFVHGAMCYCYSGQCLLSSMIGGRSGNRGQCAQPCRLPYSVNGEKARDLLSLKDMCTIELLPELIEAGIDSFKIEGRMKQPEYVHTVVGIYRKYVDLYYEKGKNGYRVSAKDQACLEGAYQRRGYCDGYYRRQNGKEMLSLIRPVGRKDQTEVKYNDKIKEKINGKLILSEGKRATLCMEYKGSRETFSVKIQGETVQTALKAPLDRERIEKQMRKTGNTEFTFERLEICLEGNIFLPMQALNDLRRKGIAELEKELLSRYRRDTDMDREFSGLEPEEKKKEKPRLEVSVQKLDQLEAAVRVEGVNRIYVDGTIAFAETVLQCVEKIRSRKEQQVYVAMPYIFRDRAVSCYEVLYGKLTAFYDGVLIRNWESYEWLWEKGYTKPIVSDCNVYVFNRESKRFVNRTEIREYTFPAELNFSELKEITGNGIFIAYGYQPVMITANCIRQTTGACTGKDGLIWIQDRYQKKFAVKNYCKYCYNVMYNYVPLMLPDMAEEIKSLSPCGIRLDFVTEGGKKTEEIIRMYEKSFKTEEKTEMPDVEYTRGHFKRGVK